MTLLFSGEHLKKHSKNAQGEATSSLLMDRSCVRIHGTVGKALPVRNNLMSRLAVIDE